MLTETSPEFVKFKKYWTDTYPNTNPTPNKYKDAVLVVGAGITGLSTAVRLSLDGYKVTVIAKEFVPEDPMAPGYVSTVAGALWEYPPAVCGRYCVEYSDDRNKGWAISSYDFFSGLSEIPGDHGVKMKDTIFYTKFRMEERIVEYEKMQDYAKYCRDFKRGLHLVRKDLISPEQVATINDCYQVSCPVIHTNKYLKYLHLLADSLGITFITGEVPGPLQKYEAKIHKQYGVNIIINCSGLGSRKLVPDSDVYPMRGALVRVWNDGRDFPVINSAHAFAHDTHKVDEDGNSLQDIIFMVPRGDVLLLGGCAEKNINNIKSDTLENYEPFREMLKRCQDFMPILNKATIIKDEPIRVGLRPAHETGVKNFLQQGTKIIHSYAHGGYGFTFSIGCANEVLARVQNLSEKTAPLVSARL